MPARSLELRLRELERSLLSDASFGPTADIPFAIFVYDPGQELEIRRQVDFATTRLRNEGRRVEVVDLGVLFWDCLRQHPDGPDALIQAEQGTADLEPVLREAHQLVAGRSPHEPGPLERRIIEIASDRSPEVLFLVRAGELFPVYRTSALLERLIGQIRQRTVLFYPGIMEGSAPRFMGVCEPSPNYRATIFA